MMQLEPDESQSHELSEESVEERVAALETDLDSVQHVEWERLLQEHGGAVVQIFVVKVRLYRLLI